MLCYHNFGTSVILSLLPLVEQELHPFRSTSVQPRFSGVRVTRSLVLWIVVFPFLLFSFGHCVVCYSIYGFWLPLWYLWFADSDYLFGNFDLRILITSLVSLIYGFWLPLWYLWFTDSDYLPLVSSNSFWANLMQVIEIECNSLKKNRSRYIDVKQSEALWLIRSYTSIPRNVIRVCT
jgi:hypothetical protein